MNDIAQHHNYNDDGNYYAAIDMGSNSFHMVVVRVLHGNVQIINKIKQKVRLAAGLDEEFTLDQPSLERGWKCLESFAERLQDIPPQNTRIVATATLRLAVNAGEFIDTAERILNRKIDVISGREEAKQIYLGVAYTSANQGNSLVIDIGGASTEIIIGNDMQPIHMCSLDIGCVTVMENLFVGGKLLQTHFEKAKSAATQLISQVSDSFLCFDWQQCLGASGTPQAITEILVARGISDSIRLEYLYQLEKECVECKHIDQLKIDGLQEERRPIFPSGLAILIALFEQLDIASMNISGGALREGLLYGMLDNATENDRQKQTLNILMQRYHIDAEQASRVADLSLQLCEQYRKQNTDYPKVYLAVLRAAAMLHELGLHVEYKRHHQHAAYLLEHIDMPGFTKLQKTVVKDLVGAHRNAIESNVFDAYHSDIQPILVVALRIMRIAVVLCIRRQNNLLPKIAINIYGNKWTLSFPKGWLKAHPLVLAELTNEAWLQHRAGWQLSFV